MGNLVNITAGGAFAQRMDAPAPPAISGMSFGSIGDDNVILVNSTLTASESHFIPIFVPSKRNVDAFVIIPGTSNLTNDLELALYNIDTTGVKLGTKIIGATQTSTFSASTYTEITFASTEVDEGWYWLGASGISASAGPNMGSWDLTTSGKWAPNPIQGFGIDGAWTATPQVGRFEAAAALDTVAVGATLTAINIAESILLRLRNA